ncbi:hypothetical protein K431DRAFT_293786 [Polychaeton citri CBS 116435]|uniref:Uncharacterized protein n=1 Tax=Polychaeton citri CBS 116435 TaxID=1314669 RepID=A0A9P4UPU0_9PEZI|nr:hypothetical protein K431DRAFT_293786 [Polychaeton citri CBS 116435]
MYPHVVGIQLLHVTQAALAGYGVYQSYVAVTNLRLYEQTSEKLADWSNEAAHQLHKTRTTQTSGALAILASLVTATALAIQGDDLPGWVKSFANPALLLGVFFARGHIKSYWAPSDGKTVGFKVPMPGMQQYNEAQTKTERLLQVLEWLQYSWVVTSLAATFGGYS